MVSGHVLQPAMVAVQKLDDIWKARVKERIQGKVLQFIVGNIEILPLNLTKMHGSIACNKS